MTTMIFDLISGLSPRRLRWTPLVLLLLLLIAPTYHQNVSTITNINGTTLAPPVTSGLPDLIPTKTTSSSSNSIADFIVSTTTTTAIVVDSKDAGNYSQITTSSSIHHHHHRGESNFTLDDSLSETTVDANDDDNNNDNDEDDISDDLDIGGNNHGGKPSSTSTEDVGTSGATDDGSMVEPTLVLAINASSVAISNCTDVDFKCFVTVPAGIVDRNVTIWWTFRGQNVSSSTLPGGRVTNGVKNSMLNVECAQFGVHNGDFQCHASYDHGTIFNSSAIPFEISVLVLEPIDQSNRTISQEIDTRVQLDCHVLGYPRPHIIWQRHDPNTLITTDVEPDGRVYIETPSPSDVAENFTKPLKSFQSVLLFETLKRSDNGSYICRASNAQKSEKTQDFNVIVLEVPEIHIEKIEIENKTSALVSFVVDYNGNLPILGYRLELKNFTQENFTWVPFSFSPESIVTQHNYSTIKLDNLAHAANYGFRLAATNRAGQSTDWSYMNITVPADAPSPIYNVHLLSKSNETLLFGWKRPQHDNGSPIILFQQVLKDNAGGIVWNQTINHTQSRVKHMSLFSNLQPGTQYTFQIRACSEIGCSDWSPLFEAQTSDGIADPPRNIRLDCVFDLLAQQTNATIVWQAPNNPRGSILGYNISLEGYSTYRNAQNRMVLDQFQQSYIVNGNETFQYRVPLKPNSNYTVRLCALNRAGCGQLSHLTSSSMCQSSPTVPSEFPPGMRLERFRPLAINNNPNYREVQVSSLAPDRQLKFFVPRISERNGPFRCIRIIVFRLPSPPERPDAAATSAAGNGSAIGNDTKTITVPEQNRDSWFFNQFLDSGADVPLTTYRLVHENKNEGAFGAYISKEFSPDTIPAEIIIGDGQTHRCFDDALEYDLKSRVKYTIDDNRSPRRINHDLKNDSDLYNLDEMLVEDRQLLPNTFYTAAIEVTVLAVNNTLLMEQSPWVEPVRTEPIAVIVPQSSHSLTETTTGILYGTVCGLFLITALLFSVLCFLKRKAAESTPVLLDNERIGLSSFLRRTIGRQPRDSIFYQLNFNSTASIRKWASKPIPIQNLVAVFHQRRTNSDFLFQAEFESLPESFPDRTTMASDAPENVQKNRYPDIKSYDQTRVTLSKIDDIAGSDYINADFVHGYKKEKRFICAQGPTQKTIADFWRMIYEQRCCIIVMLTGIEEQGRIKCAQYWNDEKTFRFENSDFEITTVHRREYSDYVIRRFSVKNAKNKDEPAREVLHFHFVTWKDFLAPDQPSWLLRFIKRVNEHFCPDRAPILVHCSAGVGRTGTFIAIDTLIGQIDDGAETINVFECVSRLRHQRNFLVQSLRQYIFVYRAIMEYVEFGDTELEACHLRDHYKQLKEQSNGNAFFNEFEKLTEVFEEPKTCIVGSLESNKQKNRYSFIIPYDFNRVILNPSLDTCYINASFIQGYDHSLTFIVAQDPMERTVNEFWWMIAEQSVTTVVMLTELGDGQAKCHCYWPQDEFDCDFVKVKLVEEEMFQIYVKRVFHVTKKKTNKSHTVTQYQFLSWKPGVVVPESTSSLITLTDVVLASAATASATSANGGKKDSDAVTAPPVPILVHCSGGGDRSSLFVAFASLVKQLQLEERVDVFQTARYTKSQRHCMIQTIAQYDFLYRCLIDYMDFHHICNDADTQL